MVSNLALSHDRDVHLATAATMPLTICGKEVTGRPQIASGPLCSECWSTQQTLLLPDACLVCGHEGVVLTRRADGTLVCVDCDSKEHGEETYA